ncbi:MAG: hypothetical protein KC486_19190, partial [Myxococcales bacterium]|nr:hypothetical protein [Myxococcales bacterium]
PPVPERGEPGDGRRVAGTIAVEGSVEAGVGEADASATSSAGPDTPTAAAAAPLLTAAELERPLLRREDLPPGYFLSGAELGPRSASRRWSAPTPEVELGAIELLHVDTRGGRPPERDLSEGLGPLDDHLGLGEAGDRVRLYGGTPKAELGLRPRLSYIAVVERGPSLLKIKIIEGAEADAGALIPTALRPLVERSLVRLGRAPDPSPAALQPLSREKLAMTLLLAEDVVPLPGPRPEKAPSSDGDAYRAAAAEAGAAASVVQTWRGRGGETRGTSLAQVVDRRATFASEAEAQRFIARRLAGDADFEAATRHVARERSGGPEGIAAVADSEDDEDLKRAALEIVDDAAVTYRILDLAPWVRRLVSRPTRTGDGQVVGGRYLAIGRAGSLVAEVEVLAYHGAGASEVAASRVLELLDLGLDRAVDAVEGAAPKAPVLVVPEADPGASGLQITGSGPGGSRSRSRQIRDYWRSPPKEGIGWVGFYYGGPASRQDIEGVAVRSRYTLNFDAAVLIRPRIYFGFAYRRSKWRTVDVDPALNLNINRLEVYYGLPLLALPPTWRVRPELYGIAGLGFGWAVARFAYDDGGSDVDASVGGGAILGAEAALDVRTGEKYGVRLRGGVIRGLYSYAQDHLAERRFADSLQWFAGLSVGFY